MLDQAKVNRNRTRPNAVLAGGLLFFGVIALFIGFAARPSVIQARPVASDAAQYIRFELRTAPGKAGGNSADLISILFSDSSADRTDPGRPLFGSDTLQEFSFSGRDAQDAALFRFDRVIRDSFFLNARFIRVVNHGDDGWAGDSISISVGDGKSFRPIVDRQSLYPRKGLSRDGAIQDFNRATWSQRVYWEAELQRIRADRAPSKK